MPSSPFLHFESLSKALFWFFNKLFIYYSKPRNPGNHALFRSTVSSRPPPDLIKTYATFRKIKQILNQNLTPRQIKILELLYTASGFSPYDVAKIQKLSTRRIRQIRQESLQSVRPDFESLSIIPNPKHFDSPVYLQDEIQT